MALTKVTYSMINAPRAYIMDYIPTGTNTATTDCTAYVQQAIDETSGHKELIFPGDQIFLLSNLTIYSGTHITVEGPGYTTSTNFMFTASGRNTSYAIKTSGYAENIIIKNLVIEGDGTGVNGFYIPNNPGDTVYYSDIQISVKNFQYGFYCEGSLWTSKLDLYVEKAHYGFVRTSSSYNTSNDLNFKFLWCFHGAQLHKTVYSRLWGFMEECGLTAVSHIPSAWAPTNQAPIGLEVIGSGQLDIHYLGAEKSNMQYIVAYDYAVVNAKCLYLESLPANSWYQDGARNQNINLAYQGLFSAYNGGQIQVGTMVFTHPTSDGYPLPATAQSYMFRIDAAPASITVENSFIYIQDYWLVNTESRLMWNGSGNIIATLSDGRAYGTWTPVLTTDGVPFSSVTYDASTKGTYTKQGNQVTFNAKLKITNVTIGSATADVVISGLPISPANNGNAISVGFATGWATNSPSAGYCQPDGNIYLQYRSAANGNTLFCGVSSVNAGANEIYIFGTYQC